MNLSWLADSKLSARRGRANAPAGAGIFARSTVKTQFILHMLARNNRIEDDLADQLLNTSEKRLARALLLLANAGTPNTSERSLPPISQETLAEMIGTTRSRVNFFMTKFKKLGFLEDRGGLKVKHSLLSVIQND